MDFDNVWILSSNHRKEKSMGAQAPTIPHYITFQLAKRVLGLSSTRVYALIHSEKLKGYKFNGFYYFETDSFKRFIETEYPDRRCWQRTPHTIKNFCTPACWDNEEDDEFDTYCDLTLPPNTEPIPEKAVKQMECEIRHYVESLEQYNQTPNKSCYNRMVVREDIVYADYS